MWRRRPRLRFAAVSVGRGLAPRLLLCLVFLACNDPRYALRTAKIALIAPLSEADGHSWVAQARDAAREWNQTVLAGRPFRIELIVYDVDEGPVVVHRLLVDPEVRGVVAGAASPLVSSLQGTRLALRTVRAGEDAGAATKSLLEEVARAP